ncbi:formate dehydrogenase subunit gamma [Paracraurococcus ruber]|uniref:Formate dehydrogenase subunit gamma n=1 Tax=Paracraurococcus ruber TaxID=77675 RepID=A0ABS1D1Z7_9PROT|nr:formate dehydrogenase subunit gamma [Paracraurococcus ruber]MBK1660586.1 formate dehydrogenase subunit gamma [Paracraurococcus ruber]TDG27440.1 formate dehydrogenase subunit gamma [Paracraurococcus ruber]
MTAFPSAALAAMLAFGGTAMAQQQAPGLAAGAPEVQSAAPEVGAGRGGANGQQPEASERHSATGHPPGGDREAIAPRPPVPVAPITAPPPMTARGGADAAEAELQHALRGGVIQGMVSIPNQAAGILIQPEGRDWREFRTRILTIAGAVLVLGMLGLLALLYLWKGPQRIEAGRSGRSVERYGVLERVNHWMVASSFVLLGLTGLNITFGVHLLRPLLGPENFTALTLGSQAVHHFVAFPFTLGLLVMGAIWARDNLPTWVDVAWVKAGGPLAKGHPPAGRFNAAQKALYWFVLGGGLLAAASGFLLLAPAILDNISLLQVAHIVHAGMAMLMIAAILVHIYVGSIGAEGAFEAMATGRVDYNYAREHNGLWLEEKVQDAHRAAAASPAVARAAGAD